MSKKKLKRRTTESIKEEIVNITGGEYEFADEFSKMSVKAYFKHVTCGNLWKTTPDAFINVGSRCPQCYYRRSSKERTKTHEKFVSEVLKLVGSEYSVLGTYVDSKTKVPMMHEDCGRIFDAIPNGFLGGSRCPYCADNYVPSPEEFSSRVFKESNGGFSVLGEYVSSSERLPFRHNICGYVWETTPNRILSRFRCPNCSLTKGEKSVADALTSLGIVYYCEHTFDYLGNQRFDFFLPDLNAAIEYDGPHHFRKVDHWGGDETFMRTKVSDEMKNDFCLQMGIDLLRIPYWDFDNIFEIVYNFTTSVRFLNDLLYGNK